MKLKKPILLTICGCVIGLGISQVSLIRSNAGDLVVVDSTTFEDMYIVNDSLNLPVVDSLYFKTPDGVMYKAIYGEIVYPNGEARTPGNYILDMAGNYQIKYLDNLGHEFVKDFKVNKYVHEMGKGVTANYATSLPKSGKIGLSVDLVSGGAFKLNKVVDLNSFKDGVVDAFNIYPYFRTNRNDQPKASYVSVKLLDAYDETKFIEFYNWCGSSEPGPYYAGAGASTQNLTGVENNPNKPERNNIVYEGVALYKHTVTRYQSVDAYGNWTDFSTDQDVINKGGSKATLNMNNGKVLINNDVFVTDLDSPEIYSKNVIDLKTFFTTGEVIPQIECFGFSSASMNVEIVSLLGLKGDELKNAIVEDHESPTFKSNIPGGTITISKNSKFYIPNDIQVNDINYYGNLKKSVYYNYGQPDQVSVESSDYFVPTRIGKYSIVYTAKDGYGNEGKYVLTLNCINEKPFNYAEDKLSFLEGAKENIVPYLDVVSHNEGLQIKAFAKDPSGKEVELLATDGGYSLIPYYIGQYEITYAIKDAFYSETFSYKVNCLDKNNIYYENTPPVYPYYMKDAEYSLEPFNGLKATSNGPVTVSSDSYIKFDGGEYTKLANPDKFKITGNETVQFKFVNGENNKESQTLNIVDTAFGQRTLYRNYSKYFQGTYASATDTSKVEASGKYPNKVKYTFDDEGNMDFINLISASNFEFDFNVNVTPTNNFVVRLTDYVDCDNFININFNKVDGANYIIKIDQFDGEYIIDETLTLYSDKEFVSFTLRIRDNKLFVISEGASVGIIPLTLHFEKSKLSLTNSDACELTINSLNNVSFSGSNAMFEGVPEVGLSNGGSTIELGETHTFSPCEATSVLSPVLKENIKFSVICPNGSYAKDINGLKLGNVDGTVSYQVKLDLSGQYKAIYDVSAYGSDAKGTALLSSRNGSQDTSIILNVDDTVAPSVKFSNNSTLTIKKGDRIKIRSYSVSDNITSKENIITRVMVTDTHYAVLEDAYNVSEYTFNKTGTFYVVVFVMDEAGNQSSDQYTVIVGA